MNLSNQQKYMVQGMLLSSDPAIGSAENIAKELEVPVAVVQAYLTELQDTLTKIEKKKKKKKSNVPVTPPLPDFKDMLVRATGGGKKGVTMMTGEASVRTDKGNRIEDKNRKPVRQSDPLNPDAEKPEAVDTPLPKKTRGAIFRPETGTME